MHKLATDDFELHLGDVFWPPSPGGDFRGDDNDFDGVFGNGTHAVWHCAGCVGKLYDGAEALGSAAVGVGIAGGGLGTAAEAAALALPRGDGTMTIPLINSAQNDAGITPCSRRGRWVGPNDHRIPSAALPGGPV